MNHPSNARDLVFAASFCQLPENSNIWLNKPDGILPDNDNSWLNCSDICSKVDKEDLGLIYHTKKIILSEHMNVTYKSNRISNQGANSSCWIYLLKRENIRPKSHPLSLVTFDGLGNICNRYATGKNQILDLIVIKLYQTWICTLFLAVLESQISADVITQPNGINSNLSYFQRWWGDALGAITSHQNPTFVYNNI